MRRYSFRALLAAALLGFLGAPTRAAESEIRIDEAGYRVYGICSGTLRSARGFSGSLEVRGRRFDGREVALFRAELPGWTGALAFKFIPDENLRAIFLAGHDAERELPLPRTDPRDAAARRFLGSLPVPFRSRPGAFIPNPARLSARDPGGAGSAAAGLFGRPRDPRAAGFLAAFGIGALALAAARERAGRAYLPGLFALAGAAAAVLAAAGGPDAVLYRFPLPDLRGPYDLESRAVILRSPGLVVVRFDPKEGTPARPSFSVLGIRTPPGRSVPLSAFPENALFRFRDPPVILGDGSGTFSLYFDGFALGWELHE